MKHSIQTTPDDDFGVGLIILMAFIVLIGVFLWRCNKQPVADELCSARGGNAILVTGGVVCADGSLYNERDNKFVFVTNLSKCEGCKTLSQTVE